MFSYLRAHHKRAGSTPTSPASPSFRTTPGDSRSPDQPPVLPPIPRVTNTRLEPVNDNANDLIVDLSDRSWPIPSISDLRPPIESPGEYSKVNLSTSALEGAGHPPRRPHTAGGLTGLRNKGQGVSPLLLSPGSVEAALPDTECKNTVPLPSPLFFANHNIRPENAAGHHASNSPSADRPGSLTLSHSIYSSQTNLQHKPGKKGLHLRNPMSLLLRRRSGQTLEISDEALVSHKTPPLPDKEPWIRGTGVHDFSAPRPTRNYSYNNTPTLPSSSGTDLGQNQQLFLDNESSEVSAAAADEQNGRIEREHMPIFKEHFEDDVDPATRHSRVIAESLANQEFLARNSLQPATHESSVPPFARPKRLSKQLPTQPFPDQASGATLGSLLALTKELPPLPPLSIPPEQQSDAVALSPVLEDGLLEEEEQPTPRRRKPSQTSGRTRSRAFSGSEASMHGLPAHMTSRASRFSFQYGGSDSALQELMLEEKHKEKEAAKARAAAEISTDNVMPEEEEEEEEEEEDMYDYDDMDGEDEFGFSEEPVPGTEDDDDYFSGQRMKHQAYEQSGSGFYMQGQNLEVGNVALDQSEPQTREKCCDYEEGQPKRQDSTLESQLQLYQGPKDGLGLVELTAEGPELHLLANNTARKNLSDLIEQPTSSADDDLYFDDGLIGEANYQVGQFNEDVFDDPSHPFYERKPVDHEVSPRQQIGPETASPLLATIVEDSKVPEVITQPMPFGPAPSDGIIPFSDIDAYHRALAQAATKAAADGRFTHDEGLAQEFDEAEESEGPSSSYPSGLLDDSRVSQDTSFSTIGFGSSLPDDYESSFDDFDCVTEDDPIIAAANAEALANDYDGFYGQEFGFYAASHGESEFTNGGYFGERGVDLNRKKSIREPNLTPITERSEYSHRNSFVSLHRFGDAGPLPSPGLAQLARMSPFGLDDEEMSFSQLRRLRKDTFGGSEGGSRSGKSSPVNWTNSPGQSFPRPTKQLYSDNVGSSPNQLPVGWNSGNESSESIAQEESQPRTLSELAGESRDTLDYSPEHNESSSMLSRPPQRQSLPLSLYGPPSALKLVQQQEQHPQPLLQQQLQASPFPFILYSDSISTVSSNTTVKDGTLESPMPWRKSHTRNSGSADSVTYVKERQSDNGDFRWVLERRRTAESGELELIGREIVEGGRI